MDPDEDEDIVTLTPAKWSWHLLTFSVLATTSGMIDHLAQGLGDLSLGVLRHMQYLEQNNEFARTAGLEIERITQE